MKFFKKLLVSIGFSSTIFANSLASGRGSAPEPPSNAYDNIFLNYWHNLRETFDKIIFKILKHFEKISKFPVKFSKNCYFFFDFF